MLKTGNKVPAVALDCQKCPVKNQGVCQAFQGDDLEILQAFKNCVRLLPAESKLFGEGEACRELFTVLDGWIMLYNINESGRRQILDFALPGSFLGYQPNPDDPMMVGAECLTDVAVCVFSRQEFSRLMEDHPPLGVRLTWLNWRDMVIARDQLTNLGSRKAQARIAHLLVRLCARSSCWGRAGCDRECELPLTQGHIADALGLTSVHVCQTLKLLKAQGVLAFKNGRLQIFDPIALLRIAEIEDFMAA